MRVLRRPHGISSVYLGDDGLSYGDYVEQLTFLLFLKMAHERTLPPWKQKAFIPAGYDWPTLLGKDSDALEVHYRKTLEHLGREPGMLGLIFRKAQNKIQDPGKLRRLVAELIDKEQWTALDADVKGDAYEGLPIREARSVRIARAYLRNGPTAALPHGPLPWRIGTEFRITRAGGRIGKTVRSTE